MVIDIDEEGGVTALHQDEFPLHFLGTVSVERASSILFDETAQQWGITLHLGEERWTCPELQKIGGYKLAIMVEVAWLDQLRLHGLRHDSPEALQRLLSIRRACGA